MLPNAGEVVSISVGADCVDRLLAVVVRQIENTINPGCIPGDMRYLWIFLSIHNWATGILMITGHFMDTVFGESFYSTLDD